MTQQVIWLPPLGGDREHGIRTLEVQSRPKRVWTIYTHTDETVRPELPYEPRHNHNAFLEDRIHDWDHRGRTLSYYSRVVGVQEGVWLLLEY